MTRVACTTTLLACLSLMACGSGDGGAAAVDAPLQETVPDAGVDRAVDRRPVTPGDAGPRDLLYEQAPCTPGPATAELPAPDRHVWESSGPPPVAVLALEMPGMYTADLPRPRTPKVPGAIKIYKEPLQNTMFASLAGLTPIVDSPANIGGHGNSSWTYEMKQVEFEFTDAAGVEREVAIAPFMPPGEDFNLWPCYTDTTCLRNWLTYDIGRRLNWWAPRTLFVEVFINGTYTGLFLMMEMVRRDKDRVDIPQVAADAASGDLTGGYIVKFNSDFGPGTQYLSKSGQPWNYHYPRFDKITAAQKTYLHEFIEKFEASFNDANPATGFKSMIDMGSWVDMAIIQELANNPDAYWRSQYLFKQTDLKGGKVYMGPLWDFDFSWGNVTLRDAYRWDFFSYVKQPATLPRNNDHKFPPIFTKLWNDRDFKLAVRARWDELRKTVLSVESLHARIDEGATGIAAAEVRHHQKWKLVGYNGIPPQYQNGERKTYKANLDYLKAWIANRITWLDANFSRMCQ